MLQNLSYTKLYFYALGMWLDFSLSTESDGSPENPFISSESFQVRK